MEVDVRPDGLRFKTRHARQLLVFGRSCAARGANGGQACPLRDRIEEFSARYHAHGLMRHIGRTLAVLQHS